MSIPAYVAGFPQDGASLGSTKTQIRDNLDGTFQTVSIDHFSQNESNTGFHKKSTYQNRVTIPKTTSTQVAVYSKTLADGSALYMVRDNDPTTETQLSTPYITAPVADVNGYTFLPGGLIYQWGQELTALPGTSGNGTFSFPIPFKVNIFSIVGTIILNSTTSIAVTLAFKPGASPLVGYVYNYTKSSATAIANGFSWFAIGN